MEDEIELLMEHPKYLTVDLPEHGSHVLKIVVVKEPHGGISLVFIKRDCQGDSTHENLVTARNSTCKTGSNIDRILSPRP